MACLWSDHISRHDRGNLLSANVFSNLLSLSLAQPPVASSLTANPRFGHTRDISMLFVDQAGASDYYTGLILLAVVIAVCFFAFMLVILIFKCCGKRCVGFLSGAPFEREASFEDYDVDKEQPQHRTTEASGCCGVDKSAWVRLTFIGSGTIFIIFTFLLVMEGITNLQESVGTVHQSSIDVGLLALEAKDIVNKGIGDIQQIADNVRGSLAKELRAEKFCPADPKLENNENAAAIRDKVDYALDMLSRLDGFVGDEVDTISEAISRAVEGAEEVEERTADINLENVAGLLILIFFTIIPSLLVAAAIMAHFDVDVPKFVCFINWFLLPIFIIMVLLCVIVACGMVASASANADFCLPGGYPDDPYTEVSPDTTIKRILDRSGVDKADFLRQVTTYYVDQCQNVENPYTFLTDIRPDLVSFNLVVSHGVLFCHYNVSP